MDAGPADFVAGGSLEGSQSLGLARFGIAITALTASGVDLGAPVDLNVESVTANEALANVALMGAGHVRGRHRNEELRPQPALRPRQVARQKGRGGDAGRTEQVDLDGRVEGSVEAHRGRRVHDDVAFRQDSEPFVVEPEPVGAHVAREGGHPLCHLRPEPGTELGTKTVEAVVAQYLALDSLGGGSPATGPDEEDHSALGNRAQEALDERGAEEAGGPSHEEAPPGQGFTHRGHEFCLPYGK